jgi:hypothetical protein
MTDHPGETGIGMAAEMAEAPLRIVDLDDTSHCPVGRWCAVCLHVTDLQPATFLTPCGVLCASLCPDCATDGRSPRLLLASVVRAVLDHCGHVGCTVEEMADTLTEESG